MLSFGFGYGFVTCEGATGERVEEAIMGQSFGIYLFSCEEWKLKDEPEYTLEISESFFWNHNDHNSRWIRRIPNRVHISHKLNYQDFSVTLPLVAKKKNK